MSSTLTSFDANFHTALVGFCIVLVSISIPDHADDMFGDGDMDMNHEQAIVTHQRSFKKSARKLSLFISPDR